MIEGGDNLAHLSKTDALTALGALAMALGASYVGVNGEFFALAALIAGVAVGASLKSTQA